MDACWATGIWPTADAVAATAAAGFFVYWRFAAFAAGSCRGILQELWAQQGMQHVHRFTQHARMSVHAHET